MSSTSNDWSSLDGNNTLSPCWCDPHAVLVISFVRLLMSIGRSGCCVRMYVRIIVTETRSYAWGTEDEDR
jgi:hypothetical protein